MFEFKHATSSNNGNLLTIFQHFACVQWAPWSGTEKASDDAFGVDIPKSS